MSLLFIIKISSYIYLLTSILIPIEIIDLTAKFLSLAIDSSINSSNIIPHVSKCILLSVRFVVLFTILGGNAIYSLVQQVTHKTKEKKTPVVKRKETVIVNENKPADVSTPLHSSAGLMLKTNENTEQTAVNNPIINNDNNSSKDILIEPTNTKNKNEMAIQTIPTETTITNNNEVIEESPAVITNINAPKIDQLTKDIKETDIKSQKFEPVVVQEPVVTQEPTTVVQEPIVTQEKIDDKKVTGKKIPSLSLVENGDKLIPTNNSSAVNSILVKDQLTKANNVPATIKHVIPNDTIITTNSKEIQQPENKKTEAVVPSSNNKSDEYLVDEDERISTTTTSTTVTPPAEPTTMSVDSKEEYYNNINKKDSDIKSFSESVRNIFDGPPTTPLPQSTQKHDSIVLPLSLVDNNNDDILMKKPAVVAQPSIEEMMSTTTPALTPQAGSTSSRRSSTTSNNTSRSKIQSALHKLSSPRQPQQQQQQQQPPQQQQTLDSSIVMNTSNSSSISKSKSRFSSIRLTRKKSSGSILNNQTPEGQHIEPPTDIEVKPSKSNKLNNKLKKTTKRFSKLFS